MKKSLVLLLVVAVCIGGFGYWGMFTKAGNHKYDEMDGMIPFFACIASFILFFIFLMITLIIYIKKRRKI